VLNYLGTAGTSQFGCSVYAETIHDKHLLRPAYHRLETVLDIGFLVLSDNDYCYGCHV
jgi:hypothetical protein